MKISMRSWYWTPKRFIRTFEENSSKALLKKEFQSQDELHAYLELLTRVSKYEATAKAVGYYPKNRKASRFIIYP